MNSFPIEIEIGNVNNGYTNNAFNSENVIAVKPPPANGTSNNNNATANGSLTKTSVGTIDPGTDEGGECGWYFWKPKFLQSVRTPKCALFWLCWAATVQGMAINGFVNVSISTIEKRYHLKSANTGLIAGFYDVACVIFSIPVSYLGSRPGASKPRWLGWGVLIMGIGSFVFTVPHFAATPYDPVRTRANTNSTLTFCLPAKDSISLEEQCDIQDDHWLSSYKHIFVLGSFLHGVGATPLYTLGIAYLDESVPTKMSSMYLGIYHTMAVIGPAIGYVLGGQFLSIFIDAPLGDHERIGIDRGGNLWLGAWWIGFLISGSFAILVSWILLAFPAELPGAKARAATRAAASVGSVQSSHGFGNLRALPQEAKVLLKNLPYVFLSLAESAEGFMMSGFAAFMPKIIESQFAVSPGFAAMLVGAMAVPAGGGGTFIGGWLVKRLELGCSGILKLCSIFSIICCILSSAFFISCPNPSFAGVTVPYAQNFSSHNKLDLVSSCNTNCSCNKMTYDPVCGTDQILYYSPCHAGCLSSDVQDGKAIFTNCQCIVTTKEDNTTALPVDDEKLLPLPSYSAIREPCISSCGTLPYFLVLFFFTMFFIFLVTMPSVSATLRCVPYTHRSLALGLQWIAIRILGTIPGPMVFGIIIDKTCNLWQSTCDGSGACTSYDNLLMSRSVLALALGFRILTTIFYIISWWLFKRKNKVAPA